MEEMIFQMAFATHGIRVRRENGRIYCWKYTNYRYDYEYFDDEESALEYIVKPFPTIGWHVEITEC
jgi:hypothetical protein